jgi:peptidoglycan/LPS O-acetylase OafA/YrhL
MAFTLYLTHKQMIHMATELIGKENRLATIALSAVLIVGMAGAIHLGVEKPFLNLRDRILKRSKLQGA